MSKLPPGPSGHFWVGNLPEFMRDPLTFLEKCARDYGDAVHFRLGKSRVCLVNNPTYIEQVLLNPDEFQKSRLLRALRSLFGKGLLTSEGEAWSRRRSTAQPFFSPGRIEAYTHIMMACAERKLSRWRNGDVRDVEAETMGLTLAIVTKALFDVDPDAEMTEISSAVKWISTRPLGRVILTGQLPQCLPTPDKLRLRRFVSRLDESIYGLIRHRRERGEDKDDFLGALLRSRHADQCGLTDRGIRDELLTFILAGHGTTAAALAWTFYLLSANPKIESRLSTELETVLAGRAPSLQDLAALPYTDQVITESLRLYPPAWILTRDASRECELGGYRVTTGMTVLICPWVTHRDPRFFNSPEEFDPDRWINGGPKGLPKCAYIPFGRGPRFCIGSSFAATEAMLLLAVVAQKFGLRIPPETRPPVPLAALTLRPKSGLRMAIARR